MKKNTITQLAEITEKEIDAYFKIYRKNPKEAREAIKNLEKMFAKHEEFFQISRLYEVFDPLRCDDSLGDTRPPKTTTTPPLIPYPTTTFEPCDRN